MRRQAISALASGLIVLAGCGSSDSSTATTAAETTASTSAGATVATTPTSSDSSGVETTADVADTTPEPESTEGPEATTGEGTAAPAEACSSDGSPTDLDPLNGDLPSVPVEAAFANSPLPSVALRRINCDPAFVNLKNEAPTDKPVLYWFWAPF